MPGPTLLQSRAGGKATRSARSQSCKRIRRWRSPLAPLPEHDLLADPAAALAARGYDVRNVVVERWPFGVEMDVDDEKLELRVREVRPNSLAAKHGIRPGDYILPLAGQQVNPSGFVKLLQEQAPPFTLSFLRLNSGTSVLQL